MSYRKAAILLEPLGDPVSVLSSPLYRKKPDELLNRCVNNNTSSTSLGTSLAVCHSNSALASAAASDTGSGDGGEGKEHIRCPWMVIEDEARLGVICGSTSLNSL